MLMVGLLGSFTPLPRRHRRRISPQPDTLGPGHALDRQQVPVLRRVLGVDPGHSRGDLAGAGVLATAGHIGHDEAVAVRVALDDLRLLAEAEVGQGLFGPLPVRLGALRGIDGPEVPLLGGRSRAGRTARSAVAGRCLLVA